MLPSKSSLHEVFDMTAHKKAVSSYILGRTIHSRSRIGFMSQETPRSGKLITYSGDGHLMTLAPTGAGKTAGPVISNALHHPGQLIVLDMKGEIHAATADARRAMGQPVHVIDLRDGFSSASLNPIDLATRSGSESAAIARSFAAEAVERTDQERDRFWNDWAETMITGGAAYLLDDCPPEERKLSSLFDLFNAEDVTYRIAALLGEGQVKNRAARAAFNAYLGMCETSTRPSVLATVQSHLRLFDSDLTRSVTDTSSIDVDALIAGEPMTLYIIVPPFRLSAYSPLLRMWISALILAMTQRKQMPEHRTLMLVDEVGNLGRIDALLTAVTLLRSSGCTIWTFWQNIAQLQIYSPQSNTLVDNAGVIQMFGVRNRRMAEDFANLMGGITADEIMRMPENEQVLLIDRKVQRARQIRYYNDPGIRSC